MSRTKVSIKVLPKKGEHLMFLIDENNNNNNNPIVSNITLRNKSSVLPVAFKVKTNCADRYWVEPKSGALQPGESKNIRVELRPEFVEILTQGEKKKKQKLVTEMESKDKFLIQSVSFLKDEMKEMNESSASANFDSLLFERAVSTEVLNTKRTVQVVVTASSNEEESNEEEASGAKKEDAKQSTSTAKKVAAAAKAVDKMEAGAGAAALVAAAVSASTTSPPVEKPKHQNKAVTSVSPADLLNAARLKVNATSSSSSSSTSSSTSTSIMSTTEENIQAEKNKFLALEKVLKKEIQEKEKKNDQLSNKLIQIEQQLKQSVEQHRTARKSLEALRKVAQTTTARERLMARSTTSGGSGSSGGGAQGPSEELRNRRTDYWASTENKGHPKMLSTYPLSYLPGPISYFVLCWLVVLMLSYFL